MSREALPANNAGTSPAPATGRGPAWLSRPVRLLMAAAAVDWLGTGLLVAASTVYFVRIVGLPTPQVGTGLTVAGALAMAASLPVGRLADRYGPKPVLIGMYLLRAAATVAYLGVSGWWGLVAAGAFRLLGDQATSPLVQAVVSEITTGDQRVRVMSVYRVVVNVATAASTSLAAYAIGVGSRTAFAVLLIGNAAAFALTALLFLRIPVPPRARREAGGWRRERRKRPKADMTLLGLALSDCVFSLWQPILSIAVPLWVVDRTGAPDYLVGLLFTLNTIVCVTCQVPAGTWLAGLGRAAVGYSTVGLITAAACCFYAAAGFLGEAFAVVSLVTATLLLSAAEILQTTGAWALSFATAPEEAKAHHLSVFNLGRTTSRALIGPLLLTTVVTLPQGTGWLGLAGVGVVSSGAVLMFSRRIVARVAAQHRSAADIS